MSTVTTNNITITISENASRCLKKLEKDGVDDSQQGVIYMHTCLDTGKSYIGQTGKNSILERWGKNGNGYLRKNATSKFARAIKKYSWSKFDHEILGVYELSKLDKMEKYWINRYDTFENGYNSTPGGKLIDMRGRKHREESKRLIGLANGKQVVRFSYLSDNKYIYDKLYDTIAEAARDVGAYGNTSIIACCKGVRKTLKGYMWKYASDTYSGEIIENVKKSSASYGMLGKKHSSETIEKIRKSNVDIKGRAVEQLDLEGNIICEFESVKMATYSLGIKSHSKLCKHCKNETTIYHGYKWRYKKGDD